MARFELSTLFRQCLYKRVSPADFIDLVRLASKERPVKSKHVVTNLLNCAFKFCLENDPLVSAYLRIIIASGFASPTDFLTALVLVWKDLNKSTSAITDSFLQTSSRLVTDLGLLAATTPASEADSRKSIIISGRWLRALAKWANDTQGKSNARQINNLVEAVGLTFISYLTSSSGSIVMTAAEKSKDDLANVSVQQAVDACMESFPNIAMQLIDRMQKYPGLLSTSQDQTAGDHQAMEMAALEFEANINDAQIVPTRVATKVLLQILLAAGSTIDDTALCAYLNNRYTGNNSMMFNDLLFASFDIMTKNQDTSAEHFKSQWLIFLHNKLPGILAFIVQLSSFESIPSDHFLMELWNGLSTGSNSEVISAGRHFLQICALHHLTTNESISAITGTDTANSLLKGLFSKDALVEQVTANAARGPRLVDELIKNDGNAGAVGYAIMEIMHKYCQTRQAHQLKDVANAFVRKPTTINVIAMFIRPALFLAPLCNMLDEWNWNDIHGESQPVYDEFGSILLLVVAFQRRLGLQSTELGIFRKDGFLASYFSSSHLEQDLNTMPEEQQKHVGDWVNALYMADGLSDDLTAGCSAKEFYMLIPTLLRQSVTAYKSGKLSADTLRAGLEYLLEPFLLPSLLPAFSWLSSLAETDPGNSMMVLQVLSKSPGSAESSEIHKSILAMAAELFQQNLSHVSTQPEAQELISLMSGYGPFAICEPIKESDLVLWSHGEGGIVATLLRSITDLLAIQSQGLFRPNLSEAAFQLRGPVVIVQALVTLLLQFSGSHDFHQLLDLVATFVVSPTNYGLSLRNGVQIMHTRIGSILHKGEALRAEALVHLARRVEMYANALTPQNMNMEQNLMPMTGVDIANINLDAVPISNLDTQQQLHTTDQQDQMPEEDMDQMLKEAAAMGTVDQIDTSINENDMFDFATDNYDELANLDDLDLNMFS